MGIGRLRARVSVCVHVRVQVHVCRYIYVHTRLFVHICLYVCVVLARNVTVQFLNN